jgi:hypothetical protein
VTALTQASDKLIASLTDWLAQELSEAREKASH